jgi:hypothetical protein
MPLGRFRIRQAAAMAEPSGGWMRPYDRFGQLAISPSLVGWAAWSVGADEWVATAAPVASVGRFFMTARDIAKEHA